MKSLQSFGAASTAAFGAQSSVLGRQPGKTPRMCWLALPQVSSPKNTAKMVFRQDVFTGGAWYKCYFPKSSGGDIYASAYRYVSKEDDSVLRGAYLKAHPKLQLIGKNNVAANANEAYQEKRAAVNSNGENTDTHAKTGCC